MVAQASCGTAQIDQGAGVRRQGTGTPCILHAVENDGDFTDCTEAHAIYIWCSVHEHTYPASLVLTPIHHSIYSSLSPAERDARGRKYEVPLGKGLSRPRKRAWCNIPPNPIALIISLASSTVCTSRLFTTYTPTLFERMKRKAVLYTVAYGA